ncbi:MAG TPA: STAS domain-containing protein [Mycobacterium sp.]|jgi:anti-anti-sigma factor|nr:STAS domain-containing protein [Mycobacterium sp.]
MSTTQRNRIAVNATSVTNLVACVHISGDVDMASEADLAQVMTHLHNGQRRTIYIDLGGVTFAGTTLLTFIAKVYAIGGERTTLVLCRPSPATRRLIELTGLDAIATIRDDLPGGRDLVDTIPSQAEIARLDSQRQPAA